jgi:hypothetical protein
MGKASSSKKVARAAGTGGGRTNRGRVPWLYYLSIALVVVLGTALVVASRNHRLQSISANGKVPPIAGQDHWHVAYGAFVCDNSAAGGHFLPPVTNQTDPVGIHTHGDGVIHVHPFVNSAAGKNAVLGKFASVVSWTLNAGQFKYPGGHDYHDGDGCPNGKPGRVQVQVFSSLSDKIGSLSNLDPQKIPLLNGQLLTIAFAPRGTKLPPPPSGPTLLHLNDTTSSTTTTTRPPTTAPSSTTATTAATTTTTKK